MIEVRPVNNTDRNKIFQFIKKHWDTEIFVCHGITYRPSELPGFIAYQKDNPEEWLGLVTYTINNNECEIVTINAVNQYEGIGTTVLQFVKQTAIEASCKRLWLITTNDNIDALRFYQKRGFIINSINCGAVNESRKIKSEIPEIGEYGIPIRDEIEFEMMIGNGS